MWLLTVATEVTSPLTLPCQSHALHMQGTSYWSVAGRIVVALVAMTVMMTMTMTVAVTMVVIVTVTVMVLLATRVVHAVAHGRD